MSMNFKSRKTKVSALLLTSTLNALMFNPAIAQVSESLQDNNTTPVIAELNSGTYVNSDFTRFTPRPSSKTKVDYSIWSEFLDKMVLYTGSSTRRIARRKDPIVGSRFTRGHTSPYRLEGNKIIYSEMSNDFIGFLTEYRTDLEDLGQRYTIANLSKNEQLAYWFNLHNVIMIEQIAKNYPLSEPSKIKTLDIVTGELANIHEAKVVRVGEQTLSLRDIRENIVFKNWKDPLVIYGFYHGEIGAPSINYEAFTGKNVSTVLETNAEEFINSLRGFRKNNKTALVSDFYNQHRKFYFTNFDTDVSNHMRKYFDENVAQEFNATQNISFSQYETLIADLTAGQGNKGPSLSEVVTIGPGGGVGGITGTRNDRSVQEFVREVLRKREILVQQGKLVRGYVTIEDIDTVDPDAPVPEIE